MGGSNFSMWRQSPTSPKLPPQPHCGPGPTPSATRNTPDPFSATAPGSGSNGPHQLPTTCSSQCHSDRPQALHKPSQPGPPGLWQQRTRRIAGSDSHPTVTLWPQLVIGSLKPRGVSSDCLPPRILRDSSPLRPHARTYRPQPGFLAEPSMTRGGV